MLSQFLSESDACRASGALEKLSRHDISHWVLAGSLALELHCPLLGHPPQNRALNDLDFVTDSFEHLPGTLAADFIFRHVHPGDPPGRVMLQMIDPENALRTDVFCAPASVIERATKIETPPLRLIAIEDLVARNVRILLSVAENVPVASKHARDFVRTENWADIRKLQVAWEDHRCEPHPSDFAEAKEVVRGLIQSHYDLLIEPHYSTDVKSTCSRCTLTGTFPLADPHEVLTILDTAELMIAGG